MHKVNVQLERLRRHYETSIRTYDHASLLDLSHVLRIWVELKEVLPAINKNFITKRPFKTAVPPKKLLKNIRDEIYIFSYMPGGIKTFASDGNLATGPDIGKMSISGVFQYNSDGSLEIEQYIVVSGLVEGEDARIINQYNVTRCNYLHWLSSDAVRVNYLDNGVLTRKILSREILIKRVANTFDASHSSLAGSGDVDKENQFDPAIKYMMGFMCGGLPLPYFMLLKISKDILDNVPKLL